MITEKALEMNSYANSKFLDTRSSFDMKKSHNKIIELNLLNSRTFLINQGIDIDKEQPDADEATKFIHKSLKFYSKVIIQIRTLMSLLESVK